MKNVTITWILPIVRESGRPLTLSEISHTRLELMADGAPSFTTIGTVSPTDPQSFYMADVDIGSWTIRLVVVDTNSRESTPVDVVFAVPDETPPASVVDVNITMV